MDAERRGRILRITTQIKKIAFPSQDIYSERISKGSDVIDNSCKQKILDVTIILCKTKYWNYILP